MKRFLLLLMMLPIVAVAWADDVSTGEDNLAAAADSCLVVWHKDGTQVLFDLDERPKITYVGDSVFIGTASTVAYEFQTIWKMTFRLSNETSGIRNLTIDNARPFTSTHGTITFLPADRDLNVSMVALNGMVLNRFMVKRGEPVSISLKAYPTGVYIMNVNGVTYKIHTR